jgi:hypothetical protein
MVWLGLVYTHEWFGVMQQLLLWVDLGGGRRRPTNLPCSVARHWIPAKINSRHGLSDSNGVTQSGQSDQNEQQSSWQKVESIQVTQDNDQIIMSNIPTVGTRHSFNFAYKFYYITTE